MNSLIFQTASRFLLVIMLVFSIWVLFRGHNAPGGGFIAALISASAFSMYLIAHGAINLRKIIKVNLKGALAVGLSCSLLSGLLALYQKKAFLSGVWVTVPGIHVEIGSPLLFDVGIFLVVLSSILIIMLALEEIT